MNEAEHLKMQLDRLVSQRADLIGYQFFIEETETMDSYHGYSQRNQIRLMLFWRDGSLSHHQLKLPLDIKQMDTWKSARFFTQTCPLPEQIPLPELLSFDQQIAECLETKQLPSLPSGLGVSLSKNIYTFSHSNGLFFQDRMTGVSLLPLHRQNPLGYRSRRFPTSLETEYLQIESMWFHSASRDAFDPQKLMLEQDTILLFAPDAFRKLMKHGIVPSLTKSSATIGQRLLDHCSRSSLLTIFYDPLCPWSTGSYRFNEKGTVSKREVFRNQTDWEPSSWTKKIAALHWQHPQTFRFHEWLKGKDVVIIPDVQISGHLSPFTIETVWVPFALRLTEGSLKGTGTVRLQFSLAALLAASKLHVVKRVGWDGLGVAVPATALEVSY